MSNPVLPKQDDWPDHDFQTLAQSQQKTQEDREQDDIMDSIKEAERELHTEMKAPVIEKKHK